LTFCTASSSAASDISESKGLDLPRHVGFTGSVVPNQNGNQVGSPLPLAFHSDDFRRYFIFNRLGGILTVQKITQGSLRLRLLHTVSVLSPQIPHFYTVIK
jgi:hypothetical protein